ncbi:hypothetical protein BH11PLA2_BH11PLA2_21610 [soil metagenome]
MTILPRIVAGIICASLVALPGCQKEGRLAKEYRNVEFHIQNEDPAGLYLIELTDEQAAVIEEDLQVDIIGHVCSIDKAFLRNSIQSFHHKGKIIGNCYDTTGKSLTELRVWTVYRSETEVLYYVGTQDQYAALDRTKQHQIGKRVFTL